MEADLIENQDQDQLMNDEEDLIPKALLIRVIMDQIIDYLSFQDLKTCRFVNTAWNGIIQSSKKFQRKSKNFAVFTDHSKQIDYFRPQPSYTAGDIDRLGDCLRSPLRIRNFPLHNFIILVGTYNSECPMDSSTFINVLNTISPVAQKILIEHVRELAPRTISKSEVASWRDFPELKYLKLKLCNMESVTIWKFLGNLMQRGNAPQLEKLHIRHDTRLQTMSITELSGPISKLISTINVPVVTTKLTSLKIKYPLQLQHLREFQALELNLREFHLEVEEISDIEAASTVRSILEKQSKTLSRLKIIDFQRVFNERVHTKVDIFPKLPNLEMLIIDTDQIIFDNIILKERFPSLKSLIFTGRSSPWDDIFGNQIEPTSSINEIGITKRLEFADEAILHKAIKYFPNIRRLQIPAVSNMINVVFDKLSHLEELTLDTTDVQCIDDIITGMTLKECEDALGRMTDRRKNIEVLANIENVRLTTMPISCLTKLRTLKLLCKKLPVRKVEITKLSFLMVLLKMDSLRCIDFGTRYFPPNCQLQPSVWRTVRGRFKILYKTRKFDHFQS